MEDVFITLAHDERIVIVDFHESVSELRITPAHARALAFQLERHANAIDPGGKDRPLEPHKP